MAKQKENGDPVVKNDVKLRAIGETITRIEKTHGKGSVIKLGDSGPIVNIDVVPTGFVTLDFALGVGGIPRGRVVEIFGPEAGGKTSLALHIIAQAQLNGGIAAFIDAEHALDIRYASNIGVQTDDLYLSQPDCGEQALEIAEEFVRSGGFDVVVIDSVAALTPRAEIEGDMGDPTMGVHARLMSQAMRKLAAVIAKTKTTLIFINQTRSKIGVMFGNPETTTGGNALKFYASVRIDVRFIGKIKDGVDVVGSKHRVKIVKNKVAAPFKETELENNFGYGFSQTADLVEAAVSLGIIQKSGSWFSYGDDKIGQGRVAVINYLTDSNNTVVSNDILNKVCKEMGFDV